MIKKVKRIKFSWLTWDINLSLTIYKRFLNIARSFCEKLNITLVSIGIKKKITVIKTRKNVSLLRFAPCIMF
jgi:hypothetical protein